MARVVLLGFESITHRLVWATGDEGVGDGEQVKAMAVLEADMPDAMVFSVVSFRPAAHWNSKSVMRLESRSGIRCCAQM
jgi:uncharacterized protein (UPF0548 family)